MIQIFVARIVYTPIGWDVQVVINHASGIVDYDKYFLTYHNNIMITAIYKIWFKMFSMFGFHSYWFEAVFLNILLVDIAILLIVEVIKKRYLDCVNLSIYFIPTLIIGFSPYLLIPYSDTMGLFFVSAIIFFYFLLEKHWQKKYTLALFFLFVCLVLIGYAIKPTILLVGVAAIIVLFKKCIINKKYLRILLFLGVILTGILTFGLINNATSKYVFNTTVSAEEKYEKEIPLTHYFMMGLNETQLESGNAYGSYSEIDAITTKSLAGKEQKVKFNIETSIERINSLGALGFIRHLLDKFIWVTTDGTFFYGGEGDFHLGTAMKESGAGRVLQQFTYIGTPFYKKYYKNFLQAVWINLLALCWLGHFLKTKGSDFETVLDISILFVILFLMFFEARSRYLFAFIPLFILHMPIGVLRNQIKEKYVSIVLNRKYKFIKQSNKEKDAIAKTIRSPWYTFRI